MSVCRDIRAVQPETVVGILTARTEERDVVVGPEPGADDYLTEPFGLAALLARCVPRSISWSTGSAP